MGGFLPTIQLKIIRVFPAVSTVVVDVKRDISEEPDTLLTRLIVQPFPLGEKEKLNEFLFLDIQSQFFSSSFQRFWIPIPQRNRPVGPGLVIELFSKAGVKRLSVQPVLVLPAE